MRLALVALFCLPGLPVRAADCPSSGAVYHLATDPDGKLAALRLTPLGEARTAYTDLSLVLTVAATGQAFTFEPVQSNGYGSTFAIPADEALADEDELPALFLVADKAGRLVTTDPVLPDTTTPAPDAIFLSQIGSVLWYATGTQDARAEIPTEIWYRSACGG